MSGLVYVASSWHNPQYPSVIRALRLAGISYYDFRNPPGKTAFHWSQIMPSFDQDNQECPVDEYLTALVNPISKAGFQEDFHAMQKCTKCVLILPCGRSSHMELGWCVGQGKATAILLDGPIVTPELTYKLVDYIAPTLFDLLTWLEN